MNPRYFYLDVECVAEQTELAIRRIIEEGAKSVFGEWGAGALHVDVLHVSERRALLRVEAEQLRKLRATITLATQLRVQAQAPTLQALV
ncbi:hypothetical protein O3G_MSEX010071 [Manduca sexta]|uniref:Uncharacterized protein n=1 Tax=Manduca sexta TaxID=7130 RepID=A0A921ZGA3_MANSE|nr:hypothetical protein O3G_MSEX010071 [Manduca sexta]